MKLEITNNSDLKNSEALREISKCLKISEEKEEVYPLSIYKEVRGYYTVTIGFYEPKKEYNIEIRKVN